MIYIYYFNTIFPFWHTILFTVHLTFILCLLYCLYKWLRPDSCFGTRYKYKKAQGINSLSFFVTNLKSSSEILQIMWLKRFASRSFNCESIAVLSFSKTFIWA